MQKALISVVSLIVIIAVGALVTFEVLGSLPGSTTEENQVISNLRGRGVTAFNLMAVLVIVSVAMLIIAVVAGAFRGK